MVLRTPMDVGPDKIRRILVLGIRPVSGCIYVTFAQLRILEAFYYDQLSNGTLRFGWVDPTFGSSVEMVFTNPFSCREIDFGDKAGRRYYDYIVSMDLEILP